MPSPHAPEVIVVTANDSIDQAVECIRRGASDFLTKPYDVEQVRAIARRSQQRVRLEEEAATLRNQLRQDKGTVQLLGNSRAMRELITLIDRAALSDLPVLLRGESGTGKELVARQLHDSSPRREGPFIAINTAAIAESLIESELFGHAKGAFTGQIVIARGSFVKPMVALCFSMRSETCQQRFKLDSYESFKSSESNPLAPKLRMQSMFAF